MAAYDTYLEKFPEGEARTTAEEIFKEWDGNVTKQFQERAEKVKPFEPFLDMDPAELSGLVNLGEQLGTNPKETIKLIAEAYELDPKELATFLGGDPASGGKPEGTSTSWTDSPEYKTMQKQLEDLGKITQSREEQIATQRASEQLDKQLAAFAESKGPFDEPLVLSLIANGADVEKAIDHVRKIMGDPAPVTKANDKSFVGQSSGGAPAARPEAKKVSEMGTNERKAAALAYLDSLNSNT